jgi:hypothetical protein
MRLRVMESVNKGESLELFHYSLDGQPVLQI